MVTLLCTAITLPQYHKPRIQPMAQLCVSPFNNLFRHVSDFAY